VDAGLARNGEERRVTTIKRIIIKPLGAVVLLAAVGTLGVMAVQNQRGRRPAATAPAPTGTVAAPDRRSDGLLRPDGFAISGDAAPAVAQLAPVGSDGVYRISLSSKPKDPWGVVLIQPVAEAVPSGAHLTLRFRARCTTGSSATIKAAFEEDAPPYAKQLDKEVALGPAWKSVALPFTTTRAFAPSQSKVALQLGYQGGHLEIADIRLAP
jgi:hypothetical protein